MRFEISKLSKIKTIATLTATLISTLMTTSVFILTVGSAAFGQSQSPSQCRSFFEISAPSKKLKIPLIPMSHQYNGENTEKYLDPITKQKWQVISFSEYQKKRFSVTHSSLSSGKDVLFAGTVAFSEGILRELSDLSGHYKPTPDQTLLIL